MPANAPAVDMSFYLDLQGIGTLAATSGWAIFTSREPDEPNQSLTLYDTGGFPANPKWLLDQNTFQLRVRGLRNDYEATYDKHRDASDALLGIPGQVINGTEVVGIWQLNDINFLMYDDRSRPVFTNNWRIFREPAAESPSFSHRQAF